MQPNAVRTIDDVRQLFALRDVDYVNVGFGDMPGQLRAKYISREKFMGALEKGIAMPMASLALDVGDTLRPVAGINVGDDSIFGDGLCRVILDSCREIAWEHPRRNLLFLLAFDEPGEPWYPRNVYQRVASKAVEMGFVPVHSCEYEFTLFDETLESARAKNFRNLRTETYEKSYNLMLRQTVGAEFYSQLMNCCMLLGVPLEGLHEEMGAGFMEAAIGHCEGVRAADNAMLFKTFAKALAQRNNKIMTFMARWSNAADGQSGHIHASLRDASGRSAFYDSGADQNMSATMRHFIGGLQRLLPEMLVLLGPNPNSFRRFQRWIFSPVASTWGWENRTCAIRAIGGTASSQRIECRVPGADSNPYLALACVVGAGLWGIEHSVEPSPAFIGNVYERMDSVSQSLRFPTQFSAAITALEQSSAAREILGNRFVDAYVACKRDQEAEFAALVTDVELGKLFEFA